MNTSTARQECATLSLYTTSRTTDTAPMLSFAGCQNSTALTSFHCSIRSRVVANFVMCAVSMLVGAPRNCSRFVCRYGFHEDVLDSVYVPILLYCCTRIQYFALAITLSDSGERMHRDKLPPQRMHAACRIVTRGSCCAKRFGEFNGNCEGYCSLEQLVASLSAANEGKSAASTYHPKTEGYYTRRHLYKPPGQRTHTSVLLYSDTVFCPGDNSIRLGRTDASRQNSATTSARSMSYRYAGVMLCQALWRVQRQL